jgi:hypothetical protein
MRQRVRVLIRKLIGFLSNRHNRMNVPGGFQGGRERSRRCLIEEESFTVCSARGSNEEKRLDERFVANFEHAASLAAPRIIVAAVNLFGQTSLLYLV